MSPRPWDDPHVLVVMPGLPEGWSIVLPYTPTAMAALGRHLAGLTSLGPYRPGDRPVVVGAVVQRRDAPALRPRRRSSALE
jgi:hypothetical protein